MPNILFHVDILREYPINANPLLHPVRFRI